MDLPSGLLAAHSRLAIDDRGIVKMIRLGGRHATGAYHCTRLWGEHMATVDGGVVGYVAREVFGDVAYYRFASDIGSDPVVTDLPPPGTQVWQRTPQGVWRTSRIQYYTGSIHPGPWSYSAVLVPAGPAETAGIPWDGDSGSICWVRVGASWLVLGIVSTRRSCFVARPFFLPIDWAITPVTIPTGADATQPWPAATPQQLAAPWEAEAGMTNDQGPSTKDPAPSTPEPPPTPAPVQPSPSGPSGPFSPLLIDVPLDAQDVMSPHAAVPDGQPDQIVDVPFDGLLGNIQRIEVNGSEGDEWRWPDTGNWWHIRARKVDPSTLRLWMSRSRPCQTVWVTLQTDVGTTGSKLPVLTPSQITPPGTPSPKPPVAPDPEPIFRLRETELEDALAAAQREIARLQAHIEELAALKPDAERWQALRRLITED